MARCLRLIAEGKVPKEAPSWKARDTGSRWGAGRLFFADYPEEPESSGSTVRTETSAVSSILPGAR
jgi:hypothetical protein